jgi:hypothetical protein
MLPTLERGSIYDLPIPDGVVLCEVCEISKPLTEFTRFRDICNSCNDEFDKRETKICKSCTCKKFLIGFPSDSSDICTSCFDGQQELLTQIRKTRVIPLDEYGDENIESLMIQNSVAKQLCGVLEESIKKYNRTKTRNDIEKVKENTIRLLWLAYLVKEYKEHKALKGSNNITNPNQKSVDFNQYLDKLEYVYIITSPDRVPQSFKIGKHTGSLNKLISRYKTYFPFVEIVRLYQVNNSKFHETTLHKKLESSKIGTSEWFLINRNQLCSIADDYFAKLPIK